MGRNPKDGSDAGQPVAQTGQQPKTEFTALPVIKNVNIDIANYRAIRKRNDILWGRLLDMIHAGKTARNVIDQLLKSDTPIGAIDREQLKGSRKFLDDSLYDAERGDASP